MKKFRVIDYFDSDENPWEEISREEYEDRKNSIIKRKKMNMSAN